MKKDTMKWSVFEGKNSKNEREEKKEQKTKESNRKESPNGNEDGAFRKIGEERKRRFAALLSFAG